MSLLYLAGRHMNALAQSQLYAASSTYDNCSVEALFDNQPSNAFRFSTPALDDNVKFDLSQIENGDMETWVTADIPGGQFYDGSTGAGAIDRSTTSHAGTYACRMVGGGGEARLENVVWLQAGKPYTASAWLRGGSGTTYAYLRNAITGYYLTTSGAWQTGSTTWGSRGITTYSESTEHFTVQDFDTCGRNDMVPHLLRFYTTGTGYVDDIAIWPDWNFTSFHGHNFKGHYVDLKVQYDDNYAFSSPLTPAQWTNQKYPRAFFKSTISDVTQRYVRMLLNGTSVGDPIYVGEWVVGYTTEIDHMNDFPYTVTQQRPATGSKFSRFARASDGNVTLSLDFFAGGDGSAPTGLISGDDGYGDFMEMMERCRNGVDPVVLVPDHLAGAIDYRPCYFGYFPTTNNFNRRFITRTEFKLQFEEMPFPYDLVSSI